MQHRTPRPRLTSFGIRWDDANFADVLDLIITASEGRRRAVIAYANLHGAHVQRSSPRYRAFLNAATLVYADGVPLVWWRKLLWGDVTRGARFTLSQALLPMLAAIAAKGLSVYYVGSEETVLQQAMRRIRTAVPDLRLDGRNGFFDISPDAQENTDVIEAINRSGADILLVGMGTPRQELWVDENADRLRPTVLYCVGAAAEYWSGTLHPAPAWISQNGFEWLYRLVQQPSKLWYRYTVEPVLLLPVAIGEIFGALLKRGFRDD